MPTIKPSYSKNDWVFCYMENEKKIQGNFDELKKKSELTDKFIKLADSLQIDDKDVPRTEKGMASKVKELMNKLEKKIKKGEIEKSKKIKKKDKKSKKY